MHHQRRVAGGSQHAANGNGNTAVLAVGARAGRDRAGVHTLILWRLVATRSTSYGCFGPPALTAWHSRSAMCSTRLASHAWRLVGVVNRASNESARRAVVWALSIIDLPRHELRSRSRAYMGEDKSLSLSDKDDQKRQVKTVHNSCSATS
jgi:hypothetical protein